MTRNFKNVVAVLFLLIVIGACGNSKVTSEWREEVKLSSGELVIVKRTAEGTAVGELGGPGIVKNMMVTIVVERNKTGLAPPPLSFRYVPILFDYDIAQKEWFVIATFSTCDIWYELGRPSVPYLEYRVRDGKWGRVDLAEQIFDREANMLVGLDFGEKLSFMSVKEKMDRNRSAASVYRVIQRNPREHC